jgi:cytochrome c biogenesis protein CcdA
MTAVLLLGFLLGVRHALEVDHLTTVATLATRGGRLWDTVRIAASWGAGHAASLLAIGCLLVAFGAALPEPLARAFEAIVGLVLITLGFDVLRQVRRQRLHFHVHAHEDGEEHLHLHGHESERHPDPRHHEHPHSRGLLLRSLAVGTFHGLAGSGALVLLSLEEAGSASRALAYLATFALGSLLGMVAISITFALPFRFSPRWLERSAGAFQAVLGAVSVVLGSWITIRSAVF